MMKRPRFSWACAAIGTATVRSPAIKTKSLLCIDVVLSGKTLRAPHVPDGRGGARVCLAAYVEDFCAGTSQWGLRAAPQYRRSSGMAESRTRRQVGGVGR